MTTSTTTILADPLELPISRRHVPNRLLKAALTESLADPNTSDPNEQHWTLYSEWSQGGCGMIMSGNVMVDREHRECPRNVVLDGDSHLPHFTKWADAIRSSKQQKPLAVLQISHPGRQCPLASTRFEITPVSSSSAQKARLVLPGALGAICGRLLIRPARALEGEEIQTRLVQKYATAAKLAEEAGWDGVEIHSAHGYLLAQFLSPTANQRTDEYGQDAKGRRKILLQVIEAVRKATSDKFVVGVKINTKDRASEGKDREEECLELIQTLVDLEQLDFIELSGGGMEDVIFIKPSEQRDSNNEGLFGSFAEKVQQEVKFTKNKSPKIILTGGFRTKDGMEKAVQKGVCDMIGLGRPIIANPKFVSELLASNQNEVASTIFTVEVPIFKELLDAALNSLWYQRQMYRISVGQTPDPKLSYLYTLAVTFFFAYIWDFDFRGHAYYAKTKSGASQKNKEE